jgi:hypothetical protein
MKPIYIDTYIEKICVHTVGNKSADEGISFSFNETILSNQIKSLLILYFINAFKSDENYNLYHESDLNLNEIYVYASIIFENPNRLTDISIAIAKHLYNKSTHPKIKGGEFYVVYFKDCIVDDNKVDAIGLFKSENKDTFLRVYPKDDGFEIESEKGINIKKLDKGCLIFNIDKESGYLMAIVDNTNKGAEAKYWTDDFLHVRLHKDSYNQTQNMLSLCKNFVAQLPTNNGKVEKATYINRSIDALKDEIVNINSFAEKVFEKPELVSDFRRYKETYQQEQNIDIDDSFETTPKAINHRCVGTMTTIKLDKNFDINIHGGEQYIVRGYDEARDLHYYQLFFKEEK